MFTVSRGLPKTKSFTASHIACVLEHGPPADPAMHARHECDNPVCCNPAHLQWGTAKQNRQDAKNRGRDSKPPKNIPGRNTGRMPRGDALHNQSLSEKQVREIWRLHLAGGTTVQAIATAVGAKQHATADVTRGRSWRHLEGAPSIKQLKTGGVRRGVNQFT